MSTTFEVAHFQEQGQQVIVVFVASSFGHETSTGQNHICSNLQSYARAAGLAGTVVPVWDAGGGRMGFLAPQQWRGFFSGLSLSALSANVNKKLTCG
ncbi:MAG: hypothetical protein HQ508_01485 [Candidatus Marinimicrobia bacterium]|nr:hypothetical protein [Candidatus Neomarinimicrobiota bacterium]